MPNSLPSSLKIAVAAATSACQPQAEKLALQLQLPLVAIDNVSLSLLLVVTPEHLELREIGARTPGPLIVDFLNDAKRFSHSPQHLQSELIARAIGVKSTFKPTVLDVTAGLGQDSFLLALLGCNVRMVERSPIVAALLSDGLTRAMTKLHKSITLELIQADARDYLQNLSPEAYPDVIYLDPMYPERNKTALAKKEMRYLRQLVGDDKDAVDLFALALTRVRKRVVVKRPRLASCLGGVKPHHEIIGKAVRFDVYLLSGL